MLKLSDFGPVFRKYEGIGQMQVADDIFYDCEFELAQYRDGKIILMCAKQNGSVIHDEKTFVLNGITPNGKNISVKGNAIVRNAITHTSTYPGEEAYFTRYFYWFYGDTSLIFGDVQDSEGVQLRFGLTNFEFIGTDVEEVANSMRLSCLSLNIEGASITIHQHPDYDALMKMLKAAGGVCITCEAQVRIENEDIINAVVEKVTDLCLLLSLARGTLITWLYYDVVHSEGEVIATIHKHPKTREYTGSMPVIDSRLPNDIKQFVETTYTRTKELDPTYNFRLIVHSYIEVRGNAFLEIRMLALSSLIDLIVTTHSGEAGYETITDPSEFEAKEKELEAQTRKLIRAIFPNLNHDKVNSMAAKTKGFNYPSFKGKIKRFSREYEVPLQRNEITDFVDTRNKLVHSMKFRTDNPANEYFAAVHLLDRMLLCLLEYEGYYIDVTSFARKPLRS